MGERNAVPPRGHRIIPARGAGRYPGGLGRWVGRERRGAAMVVVVVRVYVGCRSHADWVVERERAQGWHARQGRATGAGRHPHLNLHRHGQGVDTPVRSSCFPRCLCLSLPFSSLPFPVRPFLFLTSLRHRLFSFADKRNFKAQITVCSSTTQLSYRCGFYNGGLRPEAEFLFALGKSMHRRFSLAHRIA
jgi:hypothetical protein